FPDGEQLRAIPAMFPLAGRRLRFRRQSVELHEFRQRWNRLTAILRSKHRFQSGLAARARQVAEGGAAELRSRAGIGQLRDHEPHHVWMRTACEKVDHLLVRSSPRPQTRQIEKE